MAHSLKTLIQRALTHQQVPAWHLQLFEQWHGIVGDLQQVMRLEKIVGNMIIIGVYDASWMHELHTLSTVLMHTINKHLDEPHINRVRFRQVTRNTPKKIGIPEKNMPTITSLPVLTLKQQTALNTIADEQLRTYLQKFLVRLRNATAEQARLDQDRQVRKR